MTQVIDRPVDAAGYRQIALIEPVSRDPAFFRKFVWRAKSSE